MIPAFVLPFFNTVVPVLKAKVTVSICFRETWKVFSSGSASRKSCFLADPRRNTTIDCHISHYVYVIKIIVGQSLTDMRVIKFDTCIIRNLKHKLKKWPELTEYPVL